jgi:hypothetical protein
VIVLFDEDYEVRSATRISAVVLEEASLPDPHVAGRRVIAREALLRNPEAEYWTAQIRLASRAPNEEPS